MTQKEKYFHTPQKVNRHQNVINQSNNTKEQMRQTEATKKKTQRNVESTEHKTRSSKKHSKKKLVVLSSITRQSTTLQKQQFLTVSPREFDNINTKNNIESNQQAYQCQNSIQKEVSCFNQCFGNICNHLQLQQENTRNKQKSKSKDKKGLSILKNTDLIPNHPLQQTLEQKIQQIYQTEKPSQESLEINNNQNNQGRPYEYSQSIVQLVKDFKLSPSLYCRHFFLRIFDKYIKNEQVTKRNFGKIMLEEGLINCIINQRHFVIQTWKQIEILCNSPQSQALKYKFIYAFLVSALGYSYDEINLLQHIIENKLKRSNYEKSTKQKEYMQLIFNHFNTKRSQLKYKRLSTLK